MIQRRVIGLTYLTVAIVCAPLLHAQTSGLVPQTQGTNSSNAPVSGKLRLTNPQPLDPKELLAVQGIGGSVLRSRMHAQDDANIADLLTQLKGLRAAIEAGLVMKPSALTVRQGGLSDTANQPAATSADSRTVAVASTEQRLAAVDSAVSAQLAGVHASRLRLQARSVGVTDAALLSRRQTLAKRAADLESTAQAALAAPASDRYRLLFALRGRLVSKSLRAELAQLQSLQPGAPAAGPSGSGADNSPSVATTPTLTTLVQHR